MNHANDVCLCYSHDHAFRHSGDRCQTQRLSGQAPFPKEIAGTQNCNHGFLPLLGDDGRLDLAAPNVKNGLRGVALGVDILILPIIGNGSSTVHFREKHFGIERELSFSFHCRPSFAGDSFENAGHFTASLQEGTLAAAPHTLARECFVWLRTFALLRAVNRIRVIFDESRASVTSPVPSTKLFSAIS